MIYFYLFFCGLFVVMLGFIIGFGIHKHKNCKKQKRQNEVFLQQLNNNNFTLTNKITISDSNTYDADEMCKKMILIDDQNEKVALFDYENNNAYIVNFDDVVNYDVFDNTSSSSVSQGVNFGKIKKSGRFSSFGTQVTENIEKCKDFNMIIRIKNAKVFQVSYSLSNTYCNLGVKKNSTTYSTIMNDLNNVASFLEVIIDSNKSKKVQKITIEN